MGMKTGVPNLTPRESQGRSHFRLSLSLFLCGETLKVFPNIHFMAVAELCDSISSNAE